MTIKLCCRLKPEIIRFFEQRFRCGDHLDLLRGLATHKGANILYEGPQFDEVSIRY